MAKSTAIVVGIDEYAKAEYCLDNCVTDALAFASWAVSEKGGCTGADELKLLLSPKPNSKVREGLVEIPGTNLKVPYQPATRDNIITAIDDLRTSAQPSDRLYFYFAGHGSSAPGMIRAARVEPVLIPADFRNPRINNNLLIGFHEILDPLMDAGPPVQFYFFDACRDFALEAYEPVPGQAVGRYLGSTPPDAAVRRAQFMLYATAPGQRAAALGKGVFGGVLLQGLSGHAGALEWNGDEFDLTFSSLAAYVRSSVIDLVGRTFQDKGAAFIQIPEQDQLSADPSLVLRSFSREEVGVLPLKVRVSPSEARHTGSVVVAYRTPAGELEVGRKNSPLDLHSRFDLSPGLYAIKIGATAYAAERRKVKLVSPCVEDVDLQPEITPPVAASRQSWLQVVSRDPKLPVLLVGPDGKNKQTWRLLGSVYLPNPAPGIYRAQIELPDGSGSVRLIDFPSEFGVVTLDSPPAQIGALQVSMLSSLGIISTGDSQVELPELAGTMADARLAPILGFAAYASYCAPPGQMDKLRGMGVKPIPGPPEESWVTVILAAEGSQPAGLTPADLLAQSGVSIVTMGEDSVHRNGVFEPLSGFTVAGEFRCPAPIGPAVVELRLPGFLDTRIAVVALPGRVTVMVVVVSDDDTIDVQQYMFARVLDPRLPPFTTPDLRDIDLAQRYYASGERFPEPLLNRLIQLKVFDPLLACMAGYELVRGGRGAEYVGSPSPDAGPDQYENSAMTNMLKFFGSIPDSHILAGLVDPANKTSHFQNAINTGVPLFIEGFIALQSFYKVLPEPFGALAHSMIAGGLWTSWVAREPILLIENGRFEEPPAMWSELEQSRSQIESLLPGVGAVESVEQQTGAQHVAGTAFLIAPDRIVTSMNTVKQIGEKLETGWRPRPGLACYFNPAEDPAHSTGSRIAVTGIEVIHERVAVLTLAQPAASPPCRLADPETTLNMWEQVYIVGYPAYDTRQDPETTTRALEGRVDVKRLQPGVILSIEAERNTFDYSCFTLGGNGGSPVVHLKTGVVLGMHWGGWLKAYTRGRGTAIYGLPALRALLAR